jgi:ABC-type transporter Mla subunit MlaD
MNPHHRDVLIGLTAVLTVLALSIILMLFGEIRFASTWTLTLNAPDAAGLAPGSIVQLNGVPVGSVRSVENTKEGPWQVRIITNIDEGVVVADTVQPLVTARLLGGNAGLYLETMPGAGASLPVDGTAVLEGPLPSMAMRDLNRQLDRRLDPALASLEALTTPWAAVGKGLSQWLDDDELQQGAKDLLHLGIASLDRSVEAMERFTQLTRNLDSRTDELSNQAMAAARQLTEALDQSTRIFAVILEGEGTIGQMIRNPDLYRSLTSTSKELDRLTRAMRLLVDQIREEGVGPLFAP